MNDLLIKNAKIVCCDKKNKIYEKGSILIKNGVIVDIFSKDEKLPNAKKVINHKGKLLTPGFIDCHTHVTYGGDRSYEFEERLQGVNYKTIARRGGGILSTVKATRLASHKELYFNTKERIMNMMSRGTTTCEVKSGYGLTFKQELKILNVAKLLDNKEVISIIPTFLAAHTLPMEYKEKSVYVDHIIVDMLPKLKMAKISKTVDGFCETVGFSYDQIRRLFTAAKKYGFTIKIHAEQLSNQEGAVLASRLNALSADHLEYLLDKDVINLRKNNTIAVVLPGAFYFLKEINKPPIKALIDSGIDIAIATDSNPGTSPFLSLPLMMNMACVFFKITPYESLKGVTLNAAKALGVSDQIGSINIGKKGDLVLWNCYNYNEIVYNSTYNQLELYIKNGDIVNLSKVRKKL